MKIKSQTVRDIANKKNNAPPTVNQHGTIGELVALFAARPDVNCVYVVDCMHRILGYIELRELVSEIYLYLQQLNNRNFNSFIRRLLEAKITGLTRMHSQWADSNEAFHNAILKMLLNDRIELPIMNVEGKIEGSIKMQNLLELINNYQKTMAFSGRRIRRQS